MESTETESCWSGTIRNSAKTDSDARLAVVVIVVAAAVVAQILILCSHCSIYSKNQCFILNTLNPMTLLIIRIVALIRIVARNFKS